MLYKSPYQNHYVYNYVIYFTRDFTSDLTIPPNCCWLNRWWNLPISPWKLRWNLHVPIIPSPRPQGPSRSGDPLRSLPFTKSHCLEICFMMEWTQCVLNVFYDGLVMICYTLFWWNLWWVSMDLRWIYDGIRMIQDRFICICANKKSSQRHIGSVPG